MFSVPSIPFGTSTISGQSSFKTVLKDFFLCGDLLVGDKVFLFLSLLSRPTGGDPDGFKKLGGLGLYGERFSGITLVHE